VEDHANLLENLEGSQRTQSVADAIAVMPDTVGFGAPSALSDTVRAHQKPSAAAVYAYLYA
jgi:hypothetical protein